MTPRDDSTTPLSQEALVRYHVVSLVRARVLKGEDRAIAVAEVAELEHPTPAGELCRFSRRTVYRWLSRYERGGAAALEDPPRETTTASRVLCEKLLAFLAKERGTDRQASIPELLRRAKERGLLASTSDVDRTTVFRALVRMKVATGRTKKERDRDMRRFAYAHRMEMVMADGKHFRAGAERLRRVAYFFLDDATRHGLHAVVGPSESADLFLPAFHHVLRAHGRMGILYLDHGSGFIATSVAEVCRRLGISLLHGEKRYPEGHGKIEKFNQTAKAAVLRALDGRPDVDPECSALELRIRHWLRQTYNHTPHESLVLEVNGTTRLESPAERWARDERELSHLTDEDLRRAFVLYLERTMSNDRLVSIDSVDYELPRELAPGGRDRTRVLITHRLLEATYHVLGKDGQLVRIHPVDLAANARSPRARRDPGKADDVTTPPVRTAADLAFERALGPIIDDEGSVLPARELQDESPDDPQDPEKTIP